MKPEPHPDLFALAAGPMLTPDQRWRLQMTRSKKRGHAAPIGSGPEGETCKTCQNLVRRTGAARTFLKCGLRVAIWTNSYGTDVRAGDAACKKWEPITAGQAEESVG